VCIVFTNFADEVTLQAIVPATLVAENIKKGAIRPDLSRQLKQPVHDVQILVSLKSQKVRRIPHSGKYKRHLFKPK
jgi:hypothetical protein